MNCYAAVLQEHDAHPRSGYPKTYAARIMSKFKLQLPNFMFIFCFGLYNIKTQQN